MITRSKSDILSCSMFCVRVYEAYKGPGCPELCVLLFIQLLPQQATGSITITHSVDEGWNCSRIRLLW